MTTPIAIEVLQLPDETYVARLADHPEARCTVSESFTDRAVVRLLREQRIITTTLLLPEDQ